MRRPTLSRRLRFATAAAVVALALWTSACPTMIYPLYRAQWGLDSTAVAWVFAAYPLALIPVLLLLGDLSDRIGRRQSMLAGLAAELVGVLAFAVAPDAGWLIAGRALMGIGVGLSLSPASIAMVEHSAPGRERAASATATGVSAAGIAAAMIIGGGLAEYAPAPLRLSYVVLAVAIAVTATLVLLMPRDRRDAATERWRPRAIVIPRGRRLLFAAGAVAFASAFLLGAIVLPLGADIAQELAGSTNALVTGSLLALFAACIAIGSLIARRIRHWTLVIAGGAGSLAAVWMFVATGATHSLPLFCLTSAVAGLAYAFAFTGGLMVFEAYAHPEHRASMVSGGYLAGYLAQGLGAPAIGAVTTAGGLMAGLLAGAIAFGAVFAVAAIGGVLARRATRS